MLEHDIQKEFGIFRSLCQDPQTQSWRKMCGYLDRWEYDWEMREFQELFLPYLRDQLDHWPDDVRRFAPHHWVEHALVGRDVPQFEFCTALQFVSQVVDPRAMKNLVGQGHLGAVTYVDLIAPRLDDQRFVREIFAHPKAMPNLKEIRAPQRHIKHYPPELKKKATARGITFSFPD